MGRGQWNAWAAPSSWWPQRDASSRERGGWQQQRSPSQKRQRTTARAWRACLCGQWTYEDRLDQRPACASGRAWPERGQSSADSPQALLAAAETDPVVAASPFLLPLLRVLGSDPASAHLATALIQAEQRKAAEAPGLAAGADSGVAFSKAHDGLRKTEKALLRAKDERAQSEAKLAKLITAEAKAVEAYQVAKGLFDDALAKRKPEAEASLGAKLAMLGASSTSIRIGDQDISVDASDEKVQAAVALLLSNSSAQAAKAATRTAGTGAAESAGTEGSRDGDDVAMEIADKAEKRKAGELQGSDDLLDQSEENMASRLAGACAVVSASIAAQSLQGGTRGK